jgi:hypothetical protein
MSDEEVLPYCTFKYTKDSPTVYWMAYRRREEGGFAGTTVVVTKVPAFTSPSEEGLKAMAKELGYRIHPAP